MHIFVTGATGFIGSVLTEKLQAHGHTITGLARSDKAIAALEQRGAKALKGSVQDAAVLTEGAKQAQAVIHLALSQGPDAVATDQQAIAALIEGLADTNHTLIYTSGSLVTGDTGTGITDESTPIDTKSVLGWRGQHELQVFDGTKRGIRSLVIRPASIVYGRGGGIVATNLLQSVRQFGAASYIGSGETRKSPVHVDDLANLYVLALEKSAPGELYIGASKEIVIIKELAEEASKAAGADGKTFSVPLEQARQQMSFLADVMVQNSVVSSTKAERMLGWQASGPGLMQEFERGAYHL